MTTLDLAATAAERHAQRQTYANILQAIGHTPLVQLNRVVAGASAGTIFGKVEFFNPGGSVKDRIALFIIEDAEQRGALKPGGTIVEATSGNTGAGLAVAAAVKGYKCVFVMPDKMSEEKVRFLRALGARVIITPTAVTPDDPRSYYNVAKRIVAETPNSILANQYHNPANPAAHYQTTGPEIWEQTAGRITHFVAGLGTSGTVVGTARYLRERNPRVRIVAVEPDEPLHGLEGLKHMATALVPEIYDPGAHDEKVLVSTEDAYEMWCEALGSTGLFVGHSAAAALWAARDVAQTLRAGVMVVLLPDGGERYLAAVAGERQTAERIREATGAP